MKESRTLKHRQTNNYRKKATLERFKVAFSYHKMQEDTFQKHRDFEKYRSIQKDKIKPSKARALSPESKLLGGLISCLD